MPITAKFSENFYDRLGHDIADELVGWFNEVDSTYRTEFRDLFNTNFQQNMVTADGVDGRETVYTPLISRYRKNHDRFQRFGSDPIKVAGVIHSIIESRNTTFSNHVGVEARAGRFGKRVLPEKIYWPLLERETMR